MRFLVWITLSSLLIALTACGGEDEVVPITDRDLADTAAPHPDIGTSSVPAVQTNEISAQHADMTAEQAVAAATTIKTHHAADSKAHTENKRAGYMSFADDSPDAIKLRSAPGDPVAGKNKSQLCQGCHGENGDSAESQIPKLSGQYGIYIAKQLGNYQSGARAHQIMSAMAATISADDLADISAYFASQHKMRGKKSKVNALGEKLFLYGDMSRMMVACINCHGVNGKGKSPDNSTFPVIGGQHADYLRVQLVRFKNGQRNNSPGNVMNIITQKLTQAEIAALAEYIAGL